MRFFLLFIFIIFTLTGCQNNETSTPTLNKIYSYDKFDYSKEQISYFEKEFENILNIQNLKILKEYANFYNENKSYFLNGKIKVEKINKKIVKLQTKKSKTLSKLKEANNKKEKKEAIKIYKQLAKEGNIKAQRELVKTYKINNPELSLELLEKLVEQEDIQSMKEYASANIYMVRPVIVQDLEKALKTYERLAQLGELSSIMRLGNFYEYGYHKSVAPQDREKSLEYYEEASSKGYIIAKKKLFNIYSCKKCKPNRYNQEKADILQKELIKDLDKKLSKVLKEKPTAKTIKQKKSKKLVKKDEVKIFPINKKQTNKKIATIKCYDMEISKSKLSKTCQNDINKLIKDNKKISKINIIPVIDENDKQYFINNIAESKFQKSLMDYLANSRSFNTVWYLRTVLKDDSMISISTYHVTSKKQNRGVVIRFY